jgi:DUF4097 and DUF4098 domain-containing protein YvlB
MKRNAWTICMVVLTVFAFVTGMNPALAGAKERYEEKFEKTISLAKDGKVKLSNISGDVFVKTWNRAEVKIDALKVSTASSLSKAKENVAKVKIEVRKEGDTVTIKTKYPKPRIKRLGVSVDYRIMIPEQASAKVSTVSGDVTVENTAGFLTAKTVSGNVKVTKAAKGANVESVSGNLKVFNVEGDVDAETVSGNVTLSVIKGSISTSTVSGDIKMSDVQGAKTVKAGVVSGDIEYRGSILSDGRYSLKAHSGDVTLVIPADSAFDLEAKTFSGGIDCDFQITMSGKLKKREVRGVVNGGGAEINIKTFSGDIELKKK